MAHSREERVRGKEKRKVRVRVGGVEERRGECLSPHGKVSVRVAVSEVVAQNESIDRSALRNLCEGLCE